MRIVKTRQDLIWEDSSRCILLTKFWAAPFTILYRPDCHHYANEVLRRWFLPKKNWKSAKYFDLCIAWPREEVRLKALITEDFLDALNIPRTQLWHARQSFVTYKKWFVTDKYCGFLPCFFHKMFKALVRNFGDVKIMRVGQNEFTVKLLESFFPLFGNTQIFFARFKNAKREMFTPIKESI